MSETGTCLKCGAVFRRGLGNAIAVTCPECQRHKEEARQRDEALRFQEDQAWRSEGEADRARDEARAASRAAAEAQLAAEHAARKAALDEVWLRRDCPECAESIKKAAKRCHYCRTELGDVDEVKAAVARVETLSRRLSDVFGTRDDFHPAAIDAALEELASPASGHGLSIEDLVVRNVVSEELDTATGSFGSVKTRRQLPGRVRALGYPSFEEGLKALALWPEWGPVVAEWQREDAEAKAEFDRRLEGEGLPATIEVHWVGSMWMSGSTSHPRIAVDGTTHRFEKGAPLMIATDGRMSESIELLLGSNVEASLRLDVRGGEVTKLCAGYATPRGDKGPLAIVPLDEYESNPPPPGCFPATARVLTATGYRPISDIVPSDLVLSYAPDGSTTLRPVTRKLVHGECAIQRVVLEDVAPLRATANHKVLTGRGWLQVKDLKSGDELVRVEGRSTIVQVEAEATPEPVYNLYTAGEHTFVVEGVVVHNFTHLRVLRTWMHRLLVDPWATGMLPERVPAK